MQSLGLESITPYNGMDTVNNIIADLKKIPLHVKIQDTEDGILAECLDFPDAFVLGDTIEECNTQLVKSLKGWADAVASIFEQWKYKRENQVPYLIKILLSSEEELLSCLSISKQENI